MVAGCGTEQPSVPEPAPASGPASAPVTPQPGTSTSPVAPSPPPAPRWRVGAQPLPLRSDGYGQILSTPPELVDRALPTVDLLPPPEDGRYASTVQAVPSEVLARSTWQAECPVAAGELRYLTMSFWGFDGRPHTGEMLVGASAAQAVTAAFGTLFESRFPIEEMRVTRADELDAAPTGDGNNTSAFVCRPTRGARTWSAHAYGQAVDVNPFCNPYVKDDVVLPELASAYTDRSVERAGMIRPGDVATSAFGEAGWTWGGNWDDPKDIMHFSATGR
ncbi:hypothetical protein CFN78_26335 [Amycolatopsis antarctica]|uniref:Peptidase M15C domain-containing protein n=1 Tax=Amycolatopsis antarctica TaxID=1854586 RepID=A0A263CXT9_9PSEU|nr:hypothetical protein CFN78_26335 [Amycolatopsis antarctica]